MGLIGTIIGGIGNIFGNIFGDGASGGSRKVVHYSPDKMRIAKLESETRLAIEEARARGMTAAAQQFIALQTKLTELAEKRILIIEKCSLPIVREIENLWRGSANVKTSSCKVSCRRKNKSSSKRDKSRNKSPKVG